MQPAPFRVGGVVEGPFFTDRAEEVRRIAGALRSPGDRLLVYGPRRMGKTSAIQAAVRRVTRARARVVLADFSTATTAVDAANQLLAGAARGLGRRWRDVLAGFAERVGLHLTVRPDPTGLLLPSLELGLRRSGLEEQRDALGRTLGAINALAGEREVSVGVVLDEFQELHRFGGEAAEWHLRGHIQRHGQVAYVLAGSHVHLIRRMLGRDRAFYKMFELLLFGPMEAEHLARWIEDRMGSAGVTGRGVGSRAVELAGPRTHDVLQLARKSFELARPTGEATGAHLERAFEEIVGEEDDLIRALWEDLTPLQQNVLRAVAASTEGITTGATIERFALGSTGSAANAGRALVEKGVLVRSRRGAGYVFDNPFVRGWVIQNALPDLGINLEPTFLVGPSGANNAG
ncbi:MAG: ATP-binding protein [Gemmatimonadetes bacterium]|nr:ATP-binding protein [Gemmatimonadota bacterium]